MNIYWEENERPGNEKKPEFKKADDKVDGTVNLSEAIINDKETVYVTNILTLPPVVGGYDITGSNQVAGSIVFNFTRKPSWFHRTCCRFFLGWKWQDKKEKENKKSLLLG